LAPKIQEAILFLPRVESGPDTVKEIDVRRIARVMDWGVQRGMWLASSVFTEDLSALLYYARENHTQDS